MSILLAIISGILLGFSQPFVVESISFAPMDTTGLTGLLALVGYIPFLLAIKDSSPRDIFKLGWVTAFVQLSIILYWIYIAVHVFGGVGSLASVGLTLLMSGFLALFTGGLFWISKHLAIKWDIPFARLFPVALCAAEYIRNYYICGGFPWGNLGYSFATIPVLAQTASLVGVYGLVFLAGWVNSFGYEAMFERSRQGLVYGLSLVALMLIYGSARLGSDPTADREVKVALLQGNIEQGIKNQAEQHAEFILGRYRNFQADALEAGAELSIWPESSYPFRFPAHMRHFYQLRDFGNIGIVGAAVFEKEKTMLSFPSGHSREGGNPATQFYNSAYFLGPQGQILGRLDKSHLVPFGEYVPWPFSFIVDKFVPGLGAFKPGIALDPFKLPLGEKGLDVGVTICYEGVFPEISRKFTNNGAEVLVNITNDAWYGVSSAPYQHLNMYVLRSIENGRVTIRSTNTGISGWISARGFVNKQTPLYKSALVVADIPISTEYTLYQTVGDIVPQLCLVILLLLLIFGFRKNGSSIPNKPSKSHRRSKTSNSGSQ